MCENVIWFFVTWFVISIVVGLVFGRIMKNNGTIKNGKYRG